MFPASTKKGGQCLGFPDVCKVPAPPAPPIPTPFPNQGDCSGADKTIDVVLIENKDTVVETSIIPRSSGDEAGTLKGMVSSTNMDQIQFKRYSSKVYAKNKKVVYHTAMTSHNGSNANFPAGAQLSPSQTKVTVGL